MEGVVIRELKKWADHRGWLVEVFRADELPSGMLPAMAYVSSTDPGVARGPHEHREQSDLFAFIGPGEFDLWMWDARPDSPTSGERKVLHVGASSPTMVIIPPGVVHGYKNTGTCQGLVWNAPNRLYAGTGRSEPVDEIRHEDESGSRFRMD